MPKLTIMHCITEFKFKWEEHQFVGKFDMFSVRQFVAATKIHSKIGHFRF